MAISDEDINVTVKIGIIRSTVYSTTFFHAIEHQIRFSISLCRLTACVGLVSNQSTCTGLQKLHFYIITDIALHVTTTIYCMDMSAIDKCMGYALSVFISLSGFRGRGIFHCGIGFRLFGAVFSLGTCIVVGIVLISHISARILIPLIISKLIAVLTVTTTKEFVDDSTRLH